MSNAPEPFALADEAAAVLADRTGGPSHDVVRVLGAGWAAAADGRGEIVADVPLDELPGFPAPTVLGHRNSALSVRVGDTTALVLGGRVHLNEGPPTATDVHGVRTAIAAGVHVRADRNGANALQSLASGLVRRLASCAEAPVRHTDGR